MTGKTKFELVSPERLVLSEDVDMVVVPGGEGDFGVLKGHSPVVSTLRFGTIDVHDAGAVKDRIFVAGGFAEVTADGVTVLAEEAARLSEIDKGAVSGEIEALRAKLAAATSDDERLPLAAKLEIAAAKLAAVG
ncbi:MAG: F0F1 ATP synthase subunit epsilon [Tagaea sp.]|jgi:F-type H+-transporting ATPase subunit epsilon|nr:F0F1 ATP synthase subunit epsilon [Azospirillum sp.]MCA3265606.1 F0F1 ATP synthase subunit epsilon [Azospirillum sp.]MCZ8124443.1 F0F1 ATP synthase subunit epsilon [Magnetospirillum sp.]